MRENIAILRQADLKGDNLLLAFAGADYALVPTDVLAGEYA
jgi:hypothetical protein